MKRAGRRFIKYLAVERNLSTHTVKGYESDIKKFHEFICRKFGKDLLPGDITKEMVQEFLKYLADYGYRKKNGPASRARRLTVLRTFFKFLYREGLVRNNPTAELSVPRKVTCEAVLVILGKKGGLSKYYKTLLDQNVLIEQYEELRIVYVGMTRPRKILVLAVPDQTNKLAWEEKLLG